MRLPYRMTRSKRRELSAALALVVFASVAAALAPATIAHGEPSLAETGRPANWRVIDGDTYEDLDSGERYRLENIDTPETGPRAHCVAERELASRATQRARALITSADEISVRRTGRRDRYDRIIALVQVDGRDLGELMIADGLARPWRGRREPWCGANGELLPAR